jgi:RNA polymerase sigma-70 factor (ECF subfamily)
VAAPRRVVAGEAGRAQLYRAHRRKLLDYCRRILGNAHAAEDALQETFLRVTRSSQRLPDADGALRWIYRVAANYCLNELRNAQLRQRRGAEWGLLRQSAAGGTDALEGPLAREVVSRLPAKLSRVAWMYHVDGHGQHEIAAELGVSRRTVVSRMSEFSREARALLELEPRTGARSAARRAAR